MTSIYHFPGWDGKPAARRVRCTGSEREGWVVWDETGHPQLCQDLDWDAFGRGRVVPKGGWTAGGPLKAIPVFNGLTVFAFAENYRGEGGEGFEAPPLLFMKPPWSVVGEDEPVAVGRWVERGARVWGESELAVVIGENGFPVGVTLANDVTMEMAGFEGQDHHLPFFKGLDS